MGGFYKFVVENLLSTQKISSNEVINVIVTGALMLISFAPSWKIVGWLYNNHVIKTKNGGSLIHWILRLIIGSTIFFLLKAVIWLINLIKIFWIQILLLIPMGIGIYFIINFAIKRNAKSE